MIAKTNAKTIATARAMSRFTALSPTPASPESRTTVLYERWGCLGRSNGYAWAM